MARPEEKAKNMLNKWVKMRQEADRASMYSGGELPSKRRRPHLASQCEYLHDAENFRKDIVREIGEGVRKIQNAGMGEHAIRDLNDQINKLMREKWHWNNRIKELLGPDYNAIERRQARDEADLQSISLGLKGSGGYRYFGAARNLPGVQELFECQAAKLSKRKRGDIYKYITPDYYGLRDEEDGVLLILEDRAVAKYTEESQCQHSEFEVSPEVDTNSEEDDQTLCIGGITGTSTAISAYVAVPSQETIAKAILEQKKHALLSRLTL